MAILSDSQMTLSEITSGFKDNRWYRIIKQKGWRDVVLQAPIFDKGFIKARVSGVDGEGRRHVGLVRIWICEMVRIKNPEHLRRKIVRVLASAVRRMYTESRMHLKSFLQRRKT